MSNSPRVVLSGVSKQFADGDGVQSVFTELSLTVAPGEMVALVGPSGSGKSSLLHIMGALDPHYTGLVEVDGQDLSSLSDDARSGFRSQRIGFVFQSHNLLAHRTVLDNVLLAAAFTPREPRRDRAQALLESLGLGALWRRRPSELSGGERQRVAIARALYHDPPVLLCDEPTGSLDGLATEQVLDVFRTLKGEESSIVIATHSMVVAEGADRTLRLEQGAFL
ncbi:MAG: ABC transporter ATP-binding protein [Myxococcota bacterium]|nr:ABC transporter ATP-binding protein [Myxococcota bacterium]